MDDKTLQTLVEGKRLIEGEKKIFFFSSLLCLQAPEGKELIKLLLTEFCSLDNHFKFSASWILENKLSAQLKLTVELKNYSLCAG